MSLTLLSQNWLYKIRQVEEGGIMVNEFMRYFVIINIGTFLLYGWDKYCAIKHWWRVPERTLLGLAMIGGSLGALWGMIAFRHKTLHLKFKYGIPLIILLQIVGVVYLRWGWCRRIPKTAFMIVSLDGKKCDVAFYVNKMLWF